MLFLLYVLLAFTHVDQHGYLGFELSIRNEVLLIPGRLVFIVPEK